MVIKMRDNIITWSRGTDILPCFWHDCRLVFRSRPITVQISAWPSFSWLSLSWFPDRKPSICTCLALCASTLMPLRAAVRLCMCFPLSSRISVSSLSLFFFLIIFGFVCTCMCERENIPVRVCLCHYLSLCVVDLCAVWLCLTLHPLCTHTCVCVCLQLSLSVTVSMFLCCSILLCSFFFFFFHLLSLSFTLCLSSSICLLGPATLCLALHVPM